MGQIQTGTLKFQIKLTFVSDNFKSIQNKVKKGLNVKKSVTIKTLFNLALQCYSFLKTNIIFMVYFKVFLLGSEERNLTNS